jgi:hypothetical protein
MYSGDHPSTYKMPLHWAPFDMVESSMTNKAATGTEEEVRCLGKVETMYQR